MGHVLKEKPTADEEPDKERAAQLVNAGGDKREATGDGAKDIQEHEMNKKNVERCLSKRNEQPTKPTR